MGVEQGEAHGSDDREPHANFGPEPAHVTERDSAVQRKSNEVADEQQLPCQKTSGPETSHVGARRENQRDEHQGGDTVIANGDPEGQGRDDREGQDQERDHLTLGRGILHTRAGDQPDDGAEEHGDGKEIMIRYRDLGRRCHGRCGPAPDL